MLRVLKSVRGKVFAGFLALSLVAISIGGYAVYAIGKAGAIVVDTYDRPLMAINFLRAANLDFMKIEAEALRHVNTPSADSTWLGPLAQTLDEDLGVAQMRALSPRSQDLIKKLRETTTAWVASITAPPQGNLAAMVDAQSAPIMDIFDAAIETLASESFLEREKAVREISNARHLALIAIVSAIILALSIAYALTRRIIRPLGAAAHAADRISRGEFDTQIPQGGEDETGTLLRSMHAMQDNIRTMVEREKQARQSAQQRLIEAVESSKEAMLLIDSEDKILLFNSQVADFFRGFSEQIATGRSFSDLFTPDGTPHDIEAGCAPWQENGTPRDSEIILADGRWVRASRSATRDGGSFIFWSDITDLKAREERYRTAQRQAEAANSAKSNFLANMSHELRTPLNAIIGFSEIISGQIFGPVGIPKYVSYAGDILSSGRHLLEIINSVLDIAKSEAGKLEIRSEPTDLRDVLEDCIGMMKDPCGLAKLLLTHEIPQTPLMVMGDAAKLRQAVLNLLSNAVKFTPAGGAIELSAQMHGDGHIQIMIKDSGIGMRPEDIPIAMSPFGQIDSKLARRYEGTGLGLPLTKAFVDLHGGTLTIDSALGQGTQVSVNLPGLATQMNAAVAASTAA